MKIKKTKPAREKKGTKKHVTKKRKQLKNVTADDFFNQNFEDEMTDDTDKQGNRRRNKIVQTIFLFKFYSSLVQN